MHLKPETQFYSVIFMTFILADDQPEYTAGDAATAWAVDDPVYLYFMDMITDLGEMAASAGYAGLGLRLRELLAAPPVAA